MGFCRRCGDIVVGPRCKCGGSSVAPAVKWNPSGDDQKQDRWSRTYTKDKSPTLPLNVDHTGSGSTSTVPLQPSYTGPGVTKRFPRPQSSVEPALNGLPSRVSAHIASATASRPPSPLKHSTSTHSDQSNVEEGILFNPQGTELAKVYGSVLQPKETLASYTCAICSTPFPPDATIYPDPSLINSSGVDTTFGSGTRFLCRPCFTTNGGSKGDCSSCHRPVLILKSEGGFVENGGRIWHKKCFHCDGCGKNIGDRPMVDLLGKPSCADCFDTCLKRPARDSPQRFASPMRSEDELFGSPSRNSRNQEGSATLEELEERLGIVRSRENTPSAEGRFARRNSEAKNNTFGRDSQRSPIAIRQTTLASRESSPTVERLSARARANSSASTDSPSHRVLGRYRSPDPDSSATEDERPALERLDYARLKSPEPDADDSPVSRRTYHRFSTPERNISSPSSKSTSSPRFGSPASKQPTEEAIEEMKRRFLKQGSPAPPSASSSVQTTPRRRSRSRSKPRVSGTSGNDSPPETNVTPQKDRSSISRIPVASKQSPAPIVRKSTSTSSLRSCLRPQKTGDTDFSLRPTPTGESSMPLVRSDRTGETEFSLRTDITGGTAYMRRDITGSTSYLPRDITGEGRRTVRIHETGDTAVTVRSHRTGETEYAVRSHRTGETDYTVRSHRTGDTEYGVRSHRTGGTDCTVHSHRTGETEYIRAQRTGETLYAQRTGETEYGLGSQRTRISEISPYRTGETELHRQGTGETEVRSHRTGETEIRSHRTGETEFSLRQQRTGETVLPRQRTGEGEVRRHRTGDKSRRGTNNNLLNDRSGESEVESLVGATPGRVTGDLIDLSGSSLNARTTNSASRIPLPAKKSSSGSGLGLSLSSSRSSNSLSRDYEQSVPSTPDLAADYSDTMSNQSSGPSTPPSVSPPSRRSRDSTSSDKGMVASHYTGGREPSRRSSHARDSAPTPHSKKLPAEISIPDQLPANTRCAGCNGSLFSTKHGGKFVTVPEEPTSTGVPPKTYHTACFKCNVCGEVFEEREGGHAVFVRGEEGACHVRCAPPEKITLRQIPPVTSSAPHYSHSPSKSTPNTASAYYVSSSRYERPPATAPLVPTSTFPQPRFGGSSSCPGCQIAVSPMERGVVPGPQGTRWHNACLLCGGKDAKGRRKEHGKPGCGKKLDSAAKTDIDGNVWCRECLLLLPIALRQASSPVRPIAPSLTGNRGPFSGGVTPQMTGTTTLSRQFTGLGGSDPALFRQLTGGGLSPTRQLTSSPTKLHDGPRTGRIYPRPKSVIGMSSTKSDSGEGRGMFLVRQLTGGKASFTGNDYGL